MSARWSDDQTLRFVEEYRIHECLWNKKSKDYKNKNARVLAYEKIVEEMKIPGLGLTEVKNKIRNLRSTYCQEVKKIKQSITTGVSAENVYKPTLKWFHEMDSFVRDATKIMTTDSSIVNAHSESTLEQTVSDDNNEFVAPDTHTNDNESVASNIANSEIASRTPKRRNRLQIASETVDKILKITSDLNKPDASDNEFEIFGKYVASQLQALSQENSILAQSRIQAILTEFRLSEIRQQVDLSPVRPHPSTTPLSTHSLASSHESYTFTSSQPHYSASAETGDIISIALGDINQ